ncbi:hypothetical protein C8R44DRAFT_800530 [Mycena epipterygia]|nr:hypothetical protein C8R44DRAFT_800530 [Mycena epipterygia]
MGARSPLPWKARREGGHDSGREARGRRETAVSPPSRTHRARWATPKPARLQYRAQANIAAVWFRCRYSHWRWNWRPT